VRRAGMLLPSLSTTVKARVPCGESAFAVGAGAERTINIIVVSIRVCYSDVTCC